MRPSGGLPFRAEGLAAALAAASLVSALLSGCDGEEWPERDPIVVNRAPVDSMEFLPHGSRFILEDSLTPVRIIGIPAGYECTRITAFGLEKRAAAPLPGWTVRVDLRLPAAPDCPLESTPRNDTLLWPFTAADGPVVRLLDSLGPVLDSAVLVRGFLTYDSLALKSPSIAAFKGRFFYRDTSGSLRRELTGDSLNSCEFLNQAEYTRKGDTTRVRFSWVTLDPATAPDSCKGAAHRDTLAPTPARP